MVPATAFDVMRVFDGIEAVCFDAFGTLVEITDKCGAFRPLMRGRYFMGDFLNLPDTVNRIATQNARF